MAGAEKLNICPPNAAFFQHKMEYPQIVPNLVGAQGVHFVKGWSRGCAWVFICHALVELDLLSNLQEANPEVFESLRTGFAIVGAYRPHPQLQSDCQTVFDMSDSPANRSLVPGCVSEDNHQRVPVIQVVLRASEVRRRTN